MVADVHCVPQKPSRATFAGSCCLNLPDLGGRVRGVGLGVDKTRLSHDLLRFQSVLGISSPDKRLDFNQREFSTLGTIGKLELRGLAGSSSGLRIGHWSVHTD